MLNEESATFVASRAKIVSGAIALVVGTAAAGTTFLKIVKAAYSAGLPSIAIVLVPFAAVLMLLTYLSFSAIRTFYRPRRLKVDHDGICEFLINETRSELWKNLSDPRQRIQSIGSGQSIFFIDFTRESDELFSVRADIYPESLSQILSTIKSAMVNKPIMQPTVSNQISSYLLIVFSILLSALASSYIWLR